MRFSPMAVSRSSYYSAVATGADSFWLADHLNSLFPRAMAQPKYIGAARLTPKVDANLEPWTVLGHLAARNRLGRMRLGIGVTDTGRRNHNVWRPGYQCFCIATQFAVIGQCDHGDRSRTDNCGALAAQQRA